MRSDINRFKPIAPPALLALFIVLLIIWFPKESVEAGVRGVVIWWDVLFPSLFPFLVISELMLGFGIIHFFGTLLDPMMRPLFRVPGSGGFVMAMGFASGYPVGARLTSQLWDVRWLNRSESERLVAFTTTADPIFLIGAVAVGFFHDARLAPILAVSHYGSAVLLGLLLRLRSRGDITRSESLDADKPLLRRAFEAMHRARIEDGRLLGALLLDGIRSALKLVIVIGGLVVFFSVVIEVLSLARIIEALRAVAGTALSLFGLPAPLAAAAVDGLFEVTLGAKSAGQSIAGVPLQAQVAVASFGLAWAGLSVHAQIMSLVSHMPVRYGRFAVAKLIQGVFAGAIAYFAWYVMPPHQVNLPAWMPDVPTTSGWTAAQVYFPLGGALFAGTLALLPIAYVLYLLFRRLRSFR